MIGEDVRKDYPQRRWNVDTIEELKYYCAEPQPVGALMLTGEWGCGKTYLLNNVLTETLKDTHIILRPHWGQTPLRFSFIGEQLKKGKMSVKVLKTNDTWYGMTYHEDVAAVKDNFKKMLEKGVYKADLFADL